MIFFFLRIALAAKEVAIFFVLLVMQAFNYYLLLFVSIVIPLLDQTILAKSVPTVGYSSVVCGLSVPIKNPYGHTSTPSSITAINAWLDR